MMAVIPFCRKWMKSLVDRPMREQRLACPLLTCKSISQINALGLPLMTQKYIIHQNRKPGPCL